MKKKLLICGGVLTMFGLYACSKDVLPEPTPASCSTPLTYAQIKPILETGCASTPTRQGCHGTGFVNISVYADLKAQALDNGSFNNRVFVVKDMPQSPHTISAAALDSLNCWKSGGYMQ
jgi:hypothetical protein